MRVPAHLIAFLHKSNGTTDKNSKLIIINTPSFKESSPEAIGYPSILA